MTRRTGLWLLLLAWLWGGVAAWAGPEAPAAIESAAEMAPANVGVFVEFREMASLRGDLAGDPLVQQIMAALPQRGQPKPWRDMQRLLGMDGAEMLDRFFGQSLAIVAQSPEEGSPWLLMTRVAPDDFALLQRRLMLQHRGEINGFRAYTTADNQGRLAYGRGWLVAADRAHERIAVDFLDQIGRGDALADDADFQAWMKRLPEDRFAVGLFRDLKTGEGHALALTRQAGSRVGLTLHYAGRDREAQRNLRRTLGDASAGDFGPIPHDAIVAAAINLGALEPEDTALVDRLIAPHTFERDVAPKLAAPMVAFVSQLTPDQTRELLPGDRVGDSDGPGGGGPKGASFAMPAVGIAMRMKDPGVASDLTKMLNGIMLVANIASLKWNTAPITVTTAGDAEDPASAYRVADVGVMLAQRSQRPELAPIRLTYGPVGSWYVITTQQRTFVGCRSAVANPELRLDASALLPTVGDRRPVAAAFLRAPQLATHLDTWIAFWRQTRPQVIAAAQAPYPTTPEAKAVKAVTVLSRLLREFDIANIQLSQDADEIVYGQLNLKRK